MSDIEFPGVGGANLLGTIADLRAQLAAVEKERDHWKANHDRAVEIKRAVLDRPDLGDRAKLVLQLVKERDEANDAGVRLARAVEHLISCMDNDYNDMADAEDDLRAALAEFRKENP